MKPCEVRLLLKSRIVSPEQKKKARKHQQIAPGCGVSLKNVNNFVKFSIRITGNADPELTTGVTENFLVVY